MPTQDNFGAAISADDSEPANAMSNPLEQLANRSLADVAEELRLLREENATLKDAQVASEVQHATLQEAVARLEQRNARLLDVNGRFAAALEERWRARRSQRRVQSSTIPYEVLLRIFRSTQPRPHECVPSVASGPRSPWIEALRTKKALTLVCKAWTYPATELLYADIVIRRMGQVTALADALRTENPRSPLSMLVKSLQMESCIVFEPCADVVQNDLEFLLRQCTRLRSFYFYPHPEFAFVPCQVNDAERYDGFNPSWILDPNPGAAGCLLAERLAFGLSALDIAVTLTDRDVYHTTLMLVHATRLTSLSLGRVSSLLPHTSCPAVHLPALETLQIFLDHGPFAEYVTTQWRMPRLSALTCLWSGAVPVPLLAAHGSKLTYMHLYDDPWVASRDFYKSGTSPLKALQDGSTLLPRLHELCPVIQHLALPIEETQLPRLCIKSPTLRYLDITQKKNPAVMAYRSIALSEDADAPSLQRIRFVQMHERAPFIPTACHPSLSLPTTVTGADQGPIIDLSHVPTSDVSVNLGSAIPELVTDGGIVHIFPSMCMRQLAWVVADDLMGPDSQEEDISEDEYDPEDWEEYDDEDANGEANQETNAGESIDEEEEWEWDDYTSWISDTGSAVSSCVEEEEDVLSQDGMDDDLYYTREAVLQMFRAGLEGDFVLEDDSDEEC